MATLVDAAFIGVALALLVPALVLFLECALALLHRPGEERATPRPTVAVLIPAHDEERVIEGTIHAVLSELAPGDRLLVIADNCTDATASVARAAGAAVVERSDPGRRGKGYALQHGVRQLSVAPPEVVVVVDADCTLLPGALGSLIRTAAATGRPVQGENRVVRPPDPDPLEALSVFAFLVKNVVRPRGLAVAGLPCQLSGTGMAFPWSVMQGAPLASGAIAEDLQLGADLALAGHPPRYCPSAVVTSPTPSTDRASETQRRRWEHGHLTTLLSRGPKLLAAGLASGRLDLVALALDLAVPPLSLLVLTWLSLSLVLAGWLASLAASGQAAGPARLAMWSQLLTGTLMLLAIAGAWIRFGRRELPARTLLLVPLYVLKKVPLYVAFLARRERHWVRTPRPPRSDDPEA